MSNPKHQKPSGCHGCVLEHAGWGFAYPSGPVGARLTFVGESLGAEEAIHGEPFVGAAGGVLSRLCVRAGIARDQTRIANVVSCRPPNNLLLGADYEYAAIGHCRGYLDAVLARVPDGGVVVPLGATALRSLLNLHGHAGIEVKDFHGTVSRDPSDRYWVVPSFHPSHLQRGAMNLLDVVTKDLTLARDIAHAGRFTRSPFELIVDPPIDRFADWVTETIKRIHCDSDGVHIALDTEFAEKASGQDESEVVLGLRLSPITRVNVARDGTTGWTVPYRQPYISQIERLLVALQTGGWLWLWNKYADWEHLKQARHSLEGICAIDGMWLWKYLQSDLYRGLGFVAAMASDFGAWKHWARTEGYQGRYAAADGLQTWRTCMWLLDGARATGLWEVFLRDWHERDLYVLRPAHDLGVPINKPALEEFHRELQVKLAEILVRIKQIEIDGVYKPKGGYAKKPPTDLPPATIVGKPKKGGGEAKDAYMREGVKLIERDVECDVLQCQTCGLVVPSRKHRCTQPKKERGKPREVVTPRVESVRLTQTRWFWQVPFNPDAAQQVIAYIEGRGIAVPLDKKTRKKTTAKAALQELLERHSDDPFLALKLDWAAIQKVDSTYAVGTLALMDGHDRVHPEVLPKPSTLRDSCVGPNLQNVVADRSGPGGLASGFRRCVQSVDGPPPGVTVEELDAWLAKYG